MDLSFLVAFYSPQMGVNWNLIISYAIILIIARTFFYGAIESLSELLLIQLNRLPIFKDTDLDEQLVYLVRDEIKSHVQAKQQDAQEIKTKYYALISDALKAGDTDKVKALSKEKRKALEELTKEVAEELPHSIGDKMWNLLEGRFGGKARAVAWVIKHIKAIVEEMYSPNHPSTAELVAKHALEALSDLGNSLSDREGSNG